MFEWIADMYNYEDRKVARFEKEDMVVDTAQVSDGQQPYETAISHPDYNKGDWIVVEAYDTKADAQAGHERWVCAMTGDLPAQLEDCGNAHLKSMIILLGGNATYPNTNTGATRLPLTAPPDLG